MNKFTIVIIFLITFKVSNGQVSKEIMDSVSKQIILNFKSILPAVYNKYENTDSFIVNYVEFLLSDFETTHNECDMKIENTHCKAHNNHYHQALSYSYIKILEDIVTIEKNRDYLCKEYENFKILENEKMNEIEQKIYNQCKLIKFLKLVK